MFIYRCHRRDQSYKVENYPATRALCYFYNRLAGEALHVLDMQQYRLLTPS